MKEENGVFTCALGSSDLLTEIGLRIPAKFAVSTLCSVQRDDNVAWFHVIDALANGFDGSAAFVTENDWEKTFGIVSAECVSIRVADSSEVDLHSDLSGLWRIDCDRFNFEWLFWTPRNGCLASDDFTYSAHS